MPARGKERENSRIRTEWVGRRGRREWSGKDDGDWSRGGGIVRRHSGNVCALVICECLMSYNLNLFIHPAYGRLPLTEIQMKYLFLRPSMKQKHNVPLPNKIYRHFTQTGLDVLNI